MPSTAAGDVFCSLRVTCVSVLSAVFLGSCVCARVAVSDPSPQSGREGGGLPVCQHLGVSGTSGCLPESHS